MRPAKAAIVQTQNTFRVEGIGVLLWSLYQTDAAGADAVARLWSATGRPVLFLEKGSFFQFVEGLPELFLRVHYDRPVPGYGFFERLARHQQEAYSFIPCLHLHFVATVEEHQRAV